MKRRYVLVVLVVLGLAGGGTALWLLARARAGPAPPLVDTAGFDDPPLVAVLEDMRQAVLREPRSADSWGRYGKVLIANGYPDEAAVCFLRAEQLEPDEPRWPYFAGLALRLNTLDAALGPFAQAARRADLTSEGGLAMRLRYAEALLAAGRPQDARPLLDELVAAHPDNPRAHLALAAVAEDANDPDGALAHLRRCADSPVTRQRAAALLATVHQQKGDAQAAGKYRALARRLPPDPEGPDPFLDEQAALMVGRQALFLRAQFLLRDGETAKALEILEPLAAAQPEAADVHVKLGLALAERGDYRRAEGVLRAALTAHPENVQAHYFLCVTLYQQAEQTGSRAGFEAAAAEARRALAGKPDHPYSHLYLGLALRKLGQMNQGLDELRQAARFSPESVDPHLLLGQALLEAGKKEEGLAQLETAAELAGPGDRRPREALEKWRRGK
jgi:tetratricopeptide (TPR) repeat protein